MAIIDQRILIAAPVELIWLYLTEPAHISRWHRGAKQLLVLTTRPGGVGARWRCVDAHGGSLVQEMTAWIEPMGYEYRIVDGPYKALIGRIRVQPVPEGTQVQWTVDYQLKGAFSGLRDQFSHRRSFRNQMAESLRGLRRLIEASGIRFDPNKHSKAAMQADPGIIARMARANDPTRQTAAITLPPPSMRPIAVADTDDVPDLPAAPVIPTETTPGFVASALTAAPTLPPRSVLDTVVPAKPGLDPEDDTKPRPPAGLREAVAATIAPPSAPQEVVPEAEPAHVDKRDTGEMSIWDIFGLDSPSQRNKAELDAVIASLQTPPPRALARSELSESRPGQAPVEQMAAPPPRLPPAAVEAAASRAPTSLKAHVSVQRLAVPPSRGLRATVHTRHIR